MPDTLDHPKLVGVRTQKDTVGNAAQDVAGVIVGQYGDDTRKRVMQRKHEDQYVVFASQAGLEKLQKQGIITEEQKNDISLALGDGNEREVFVIQFKKSGDQLEPVRAYSGKRDGFLPRVNLENTLNLKSNIKMGEDIRDAGLNLELQPNHDDVLDFVIEAGGLKLAQNQPARNAEFDAMLAKGPSAELPAENPDQLSPLPTGGVPGGVKGIA